MKELFTLSESLAGAIEAAAASVVGIEAGRRSRGTGIVWSADGLIVTADHVIHHEDGIRVRPAEGEPIDASLVGRDPATDLAVLRAAGAPGRPANWEEPSSLKVGHLVVALGRPGRSIRATLGIVSALGDGWQTPAGGRIDRYVEAGILLYPGFSGGPLIDARGKVVGVNTGGLRRGGSVTIVTPTVRRTVSALLANGHIRRGYLGIATQPVRLPSRAADAAGQPRGLLVLDVEPGSPADGAGLLLGDTVLGAAGQPVRRPEDLFAALTAEQIGAPMPVRVLRAGRVQDVSVTVGERLRRTA